MVKHKKNFQLNLKSNFNYLRSSLNLSKNLFMALFGCTGGRFSCQRYSIMAAKTFLGSLENSS